MRVGRKISHILKEITCALEKGFTNIKIGEKMGAIPKTWVVRPTFWSKAMIDVAMGMLF